MLSSDLEGLLIDSFGVERLVQALGPDGEGEIDSAFAAEITTDPDGYERLAKWLGSRGWNSDRRTTGKLPPHLPAVLLDRWFDGNADAATPMAPLIAWLEGIVRDASPTPV